jgi:hypothetical protein
MIVLAGGFFFQELIAWIFPAGKIALP